MKFSTYWDKISLIIVIVVAVFWDSWHSFFQQAEWSGLSKYYSIAGESISVQFVALYEDLMHNIYDGFYPLSSLINHLRFSFFGLEYSSYAFFSLLLHIVAAIIVFKFIIDVTRNSILALLAALGFSISAFSGLSIMSISTSLSTQIAFIFSLVSVSYYYSWLVESKRHHLWVSIITFIIAILSRGSALYLFFFLPALGFIYKSELKLVILRWFSFSGIMYLLVRIMFASTKDGYYEILTMTVQESILAFKNIIVVVVAGTGQLLIPHNMLTVLLNNLVPKFPRLYLEEMKLVTFDVFIESVASSIFFVFGTIAITMMIWLARKYHKRGSHEALLFVVMFLCSFFPLSYRVLDNSRVVSFEAGDLYLPAATFFVLLLILISSLARNRTFMYILILPLFVVNIISIRHDLNQRVAEGVVRQNILEQFIEFYPELPRKVVIYTQTDSSYYRLREEGKSFPFDSGFGQVLLIWYSGRQFIPGELLENNFLSEATSEGYREVGEHSFGYFRDFDNLKKFVKQEDLDSEIVISVAWQSETKFLRNINGQVRMKL